MAKKRSHVPVQSRKKSNQVPPREPRYETTSNVEEPDGLEELDPQNVPAAGGQEPTVDSDSDPDTTTEEITTESPEEDSLDGDTEEVTQPGTSYPEPGIDPDPVGPQDPDYYDPKTTTPPRPPVNVAAEAGLPPSSEEAQKLWFDMRYEPDADHSTLRESGEGTPQSPHELTMDPTNEWKERVGFQLGVLLDYGELPVAEFRTLAGLGRPHALEEAKRVLDEFQGLVSSRWRAGKYRFSLTSEGERVAQELRQG